MSEQNTTVPAEITHLDFDPEESQEKVPKCIGHKFQRAENGGPVETVGNNFTCSNPAKVVTIRSCCGMIGHYCISCYNDICKFHAGQQMIGPSSHGDKPKHPVVGNPFSRVEFL